MCWYPGDQPAEDGTVETEEADQENSNRGEGGASSAHKPTTQTPLLKELDIPCNAHPNTLLAYTYMYVCTFPSANSFHFQNTVCLSFSHLICVCVCVCGVNRL